MAEQVQLTRAYAAERIAQPLIDEHHPHLRNARIAFVETSKDMKSKGMVVLGKAMKLADLHRFLSSGAQEDSELGFHLVVLINGYRWPALSEKQRIALVDHELCHFREKEADPDEPDGEQGWEIRGHDVEEFTEIIERHGLWEPSREHFGRAVARQLRLSEAVPAGVR